MRRSNAFGSAPPAVVVLAIATLTLTGCSSASDDPALTTSTRGPSATAPAAPPSTTTSTTAAAPTAPPGGPTTPTDPTAQQAGQRLIDAWTNGDVVAAAAAVGSDVANALFAQATPDAVQSLPCRGSETVPDAVECDYSNADGVVTLVIAGNASNGYRVVNVGFVPT